MCYRKKSLGENVMLLRKGVLPKSPAGPGWDCCTIARLLRYRCPSTLWTVPAFLFPTLPLGCMVVAFVCFSFLLLPFSSWCCGFLLEGYGHWGIVLLYMNSLDLRYRVLKLGVQFSHEPAPSTRLGSKTQWKISCHQRWPDQSCPVLLCMF